MGILGELIDDKGKKKTNDTNTKAAYLGTKPNTAGSPVQEVYINATPEYTGSAERYVTKKIDAGRLTTSAGKTFEFGYCGEYGRFMKPTFKCDFKFKRLKFTIYSAWAGVAGQRLCQA